VRPDTSLSVETSTRTAARATIGAMVRHPLVHATLLLGLLGCEPKPPEPVKRHRKKIAKMMAKHEALEEAARAADLDLAKRWFDAISRLRPDPTLGPCPVDRATLVGEFPPTYRTLQLQLRTPPERLYGPVSRSFAEAFPLFEDRVEEPYFGEDRLAEKLDGYTLESPTGYWFVLAIELVLEPKVVNEYRFEPGMIVGEFFVWDAKANELICGAQVAITSSGEVSVRREEIRGVDGEAYKLPSELADNDALGVDLQKNTVETALSQLSKLGPRPAEPPG
jgi:hypothetical protein